VDAPLGTAAMPEYTLPPSSFSTMTSTSTVGLPRESMISRAMTSTMMIDAFNILFLLGL
jgi:hypothetical protein